MKRITNFLFFLVYFHNIAISSGDDDDNNNDRITDKICIRYSSSFIYEVPMYDDSLEKLLLSKTLSKNCNPSTLKVTFELLTRKAEYENYTMRNIHFIEDEKHENEYVVRLNTNLDNFSPDPRNSYLSLSMNICTRDNKKECDISTDPTYYHIEPFFSKLIIYGSCATLCVDLPTLKTENLKNCFLFSESLFNDVLNLKKCQKSKTYPDGEKKSSYHSNSSINCEFEKFIIFTLNIATVQFLIFGFFFYFFNRKLTSFFKRRESSSSRGGGGGGGSSLLTRKETPSENKIVNAKTEQHIYRSPFSLPPYGRTESTGALYSHMAKYNKRRTPPYSKEIIRDSTLGSLTDIIKNSNIKNNNENNVYLDMSGGASGGGSVNENQSKKGPYASTAVHSYPNTNSSKKMVIIENEPFYHEIFERESDKISVSSSFEYEDAHTRNDNAINYDDTLIKIEEFHNKNPSTVPIETDSLEEIRLKEDHQRRRQSNNNPTHSRKLDKNRLKEDIGKRTLRSTRIPKKKKF